MIIYYNTLDHEIMYSSTRVLWYSKNREHRARVQFLYFNIDVHFRNFL